MPSARPLVRYVNIPGMGRVRWSLFTPQAKSTYRALEATPVGHGHPSEVDRLKTIPQLGVISYALEQAHHKRWEYVALTLHLLRTVAYSGGQGGLMSKVPVRENEKVTKAELLAVWMLVMQSGHLFDTFASERYVTYEAARCPLVRQALLEPIDADYHDYCNRIITEERWQQMYKVLALRRLVKVFGGDDLEFVRACMRLYCDPPTDTYVTGSESLSVLSQLAFTYLDSQFTDRTIMVDPVAIALRMHEDAGIVARILDENDPMGRMFQAALEYLDSDVYDAQPTLPHVHCVLQNLGDEFHADLNSDNYEVVRSALHRLLKKYRYVTAHSDPSRVYGFSLLVGDTQSETSLYDETRQTIGSGWYKMLVSSPRRGTSSSIHFLPSVRDDGVPVLSRTQLLRALDFADSKKMTDRYSNCADHPTDLAAMNRSAMSFIEYCFALMAPSEPITVTPRLKGGLRAPIPLLSWCRGVPSSRSFLDPGSHQLGAFSEPHQSEMQKVLGAFRVIHDGSRGGYFLCLLGAFYIRLRDDPSVEREVDGMWVRVNSAGIEMYLAEVKEGSQTPEAAMNAIETKLKALGVLPAAEKRFRIPCPPDVGVVRISI